MSDFSKFTISMICVIAGLYILFKTVSFFKMISNKLLSRKFMKMGYPPEIIDEIIIKIDPKKQEEIISNNNGA